MRKIAVLLSGRGSNMMALVEQARGYEVALVASDRPEAPGLAWAAARGIATWALSPKGIGKPAYEAALEQALTAAGIEAIALAGYMRLLSDGFVARWRGRIVNIHPSLLPLYKGLDTHARAIAAGDAEAGCSVHLVTEELDGGRVLGQARVSVTNDDSPDALAARVLIAEHALYPRILAEFLMTPIDRIRAAALQLPQVEEQPDGDAVGFVSGGRLFAAVRGGLLRLRTGDGWDEAPLTGEIDWSAIEDGLARSWELAAPPALLEAGGR